MPLVSFEDIRDSQLQVADKLAPRLIERLVDRFLGEMASIAATADMQWDREAALEALHAELERDVSVSVRGYADWLATFFWLNHRNGGGASLPLPVCDDRALTHIAQHFGVELGTLNLVVDALKGSTTELLPIGTIDKGSVHLNRTALGFWAEHYDWG
jgi:hypothetical protein